jgi:hypothetical protein
LTEAGTCRKFVVLLLQKAGWDNLRNAVNQLQSLLYAV